MRTHETRRSPRAARNRPRTREALFIVGVLVVLVLALPLAAVLAFTTRLVFLAGLVVVAAGGVVFAVSPGFREWLTGRAEGKVSYNGIRLATDVALDPAHAWARVEEGELVVGADDLVQTALGPIESVEVPPPGTRVLRSAPLFRLHRGDRTAEIRSPVTGSVSCANPLLAHEPGLVNEAPFTRGWVVRLESEGETARKQQRRLLRGRHAREWMREEVDRLLALLVGSPAGVPCLPDGGVLVDELHQHIDEATWHRLETSFFDTGKP